MYGGNCYFTYHQHTPAIRINQTSTACMNQAQNYLFKIRLCSLTSSKIMICVTYTAAVSIPVGSSFHGVQKIINKQRVLMHGHQGWNVRHGLCHIYMRYVCMYIYIYIYIWVVYSFCLFCCLFIVVTWWYVWCIEWASGNQEEVQACLVTLCLFIISCYSLYKTTI